MRNCLIILTSEYPYSKEETFLESEIGYHAENFEKIIVFSTNLSEGVPQTRTLPDNVDCYNICKGSNKASKIKDALFGGFNILKKSEYCKADEEVIAKSLTKRAFLEYFCHRAKRCAKICNKITDKYELGQFDNVVIYSYWMFTTAMIGYHIKNHISASCSNVKLITRAHGYDLYEEVNMLNYLPLRKFILDKYDAVYPCSECGEDYLKKRYPQFSEKIICSHLGTADHGTAETTGSKTLKIVSCSHIIPIKRIDKIITALALLKKEDFNIEWTHIGSGKMQADMENMAHEKISFVKFNFTGQVSNTDVYRMLKENGYDVFVNTSSSEGIPVSIMEAISFGIPVIATDVGGVNEIIKNNINGFLLDENFTDRQLAEKFKFFAQLDSEKMNEFRKNSRQLWEEEYNAENNYKKFSAKLLG